MKLKVINKINLLEGSTMIKYFRLLCSVFLLSLFAVFTTNAQMFSSKVTFNGHVYANSGDTARIPISNATVSLHSFTMTGDSIDYQAATDTLGAFTIDSVKTGVYTLTVSASRYQKLYIREFGIFDEHDSVNLFLHDSLHISGGVVLGHVRFEMSEEAVFNSVIEFINLDNTKPNVFATMNDEGSYYAKVPAGQYYVSCSVSLHDSTFFFQQYWDNATSLAQAKVLTVADGQFYEGINFNIPDSVISPHTITFTGSVKSSMYAPIANASVKVWGSGEGDDEDRAVVGSAVTDSNGNYSIKLSNLTQTKNAFIVGVRAEGYGVRFYNNQSTFFQANVLFAFSDTTFSNINFTLVAPDTVNTYSLSGKVTDSAGTGIKSAFVMAYDSARHDEHVKLAITDSTGNYTIKGLAAGTYYVLFYAKGFVPQFYMNADKWENATAIHVTNSSVSGINASLIAAPQSTSSGTIVGQIHSDNGAALAGVLIVVKNSNGNVAGYGMSDASGTYSISGIGQGSYTVSASISTYSSTQSSTTYDPSSGSTTVQNFTMSNSSVTAVQNSSSNLPTRYQLDNNYPNPFNPSTIIGFTIPMTTHVRLDIYNILGQKVAELVNSTMSAGTYKISFDASKLSSGVYLYRLETNNFTSVKKMILSK